jgi:hypothetical protein
MGKLGGYAKHAGTMAFCVPFWVGGALYLGGKALFK